MAEPVTAPAAGMQRTDPRIRALIEKYVQGGMYAEDESQTEDMRLEALRRFYRPGGAEQRPMQPQQDPRTAALAAMRGR